MINSIDKVIEKEDFNIQDVAEVTKRKTQTIRAWEKKGIIPEADKRSSNNWRLYSRTCFIQVLQNILNHPWERQVIKNVDEVQYVIDELKNKENMVDVSING